MLIPMMPRSARGLRVSPYISAPATANAAPTRAATVARGMRSVRIIRCSVEVGSNATSAARTSAGAMSAAPKAMLLIIARPSSPSQIGKPSSRMGHERQCAARGWVRIWWRWSWSFIFLLAVLRVSTLSRSNVPTLPASPLKRSNTNLYVVSWGISRKELRYGITVPWNGPLSRITAPLAGCSCWLYRRYTRQLQAQIVPRYIAQITPYIALEQVEIAVPRRAIVPDVSVYERDAPGVADMAAVIDVPPLTGTAVMEVPTRYARIEIRSVNDETLVTTLELLSPVNKRPGIDGADAYEKKRQELFMSFVHLLEIDLLRGGKRPYLSRPDPLPDAPYFVFLCRAERYPEIAIWPCALQKPLPTVPVPLRHPDPDVALNLTQIVQQVYRNARYDLQVDYRTALPPPDLNPDDATWLDAHLREKGLRRET